MRLCMIMCGLVSLIVVLFVMVCMMWLEFGNVMYWLLLKFVILVVVIYVD